MCFLVQSTVEKQNFFLTPCIKRVQVFFLTFKTRLKHIFVGLQSYEKVLKTLTKARQELGEILSAVEVMDSVTIEWGKEHTKLKSPLEEYPFYLLIETSGSNEEHDALKLNSFLDTALTEHFVLNGVVTGEPSKIKVNKYSSDSNN